MLYAQIYQIVERIPITILYRISSNKHSGAYFFFHAAGTAEKGGNNYSSSVTWLAKEQL